MRRIDIDWNGAEYTFRTNIDGSYLFTGVSEDSKISCESGFNSLSRLRRAIREHLRYKWDAVKPDMDAPMPKVKYHPSLNYEWQP